MTLRVLLFARYAEVAGAPDVEIEADEGTTLADVWERVRLRFPAIPAASAPLMAIDRSYATPDRAVAPGQEIAFFPPVSGG